MLTGKISAVLAVLVSVLFVAAFAVQASEYFEGARATLHYTGKITGIDAANKILTVEAGMNDEAYFDLSDVASVTMCDKELSFNDLKIGDTVSISYFVDSLGGPRMATEVETATHC